MIARWLGSGRRPLGVSLSVLATLLVVLGLAPVADDDDQTWRGHHRTTTRHVPQTEDIPRHGLARNLELVGHNPLLDSDQGTSSFDAYINPPLGIPRGGNGDITAAGDCVYVGSFNGYQPALIVDVSTPRRPTVVGAVPDLVPGVANGIEGIEASDDLLVIDQRNPLGEMPMPSVPPGLHARGISVYDIGKGGSSCRSPRLVARLEYKSAMGQAGKEAHVISLWRDPVEPRRVLGLQSFADNETIDHTDIAVVDLSDCPRSCSPRVVAKWSARMQYGFGQIGNLRQSTHEAIMSTDGNRIYVSQWHDGFFMLDSSKLIRTLRGQDWCDPTQVATPDGGENHCIKPLNPDYASRAIPLPTVERSHTPIRVPDRPYVFETSESEGPRAARDSSGRVIQPPRIASSCPGSFIRMVYIGNNDYFATSAFDTEGRRLPAQRFRGDLASQTLGRYGTDEQKLENCGADGFKPGTAPLESSWFSPHQALVFPNLAIVTYYGAGLRAIDISNPYILREVGHFINKPVHAVRWASWGGVAGDFVPSAAHPGLARELPTVGRPMIFAFSYVLSHNGYVIYSDVHSGIYVLRYKGPHAQEIPQQGSCLSGNPGGISPGYEPCPPYGKWDSAANAWN